MRFSCVILMMSAALWNTLQGQTTQEFYEVTKSMPVFYKQMKKQLTYPLAWESDSIKDFNRWRLVSKQTLKDCMGLVQPAPKSYDCEVVDMEARKGYEVRKIMFNVSDWCRIPAYLLVPHGEGPFPAIVMLHDHGAHFTIGKEKLVRPFQVSQVIEADAANWVQRYYDGQFVGDYFAAHGYVVLVIDALLWGERGRKEGADYAVQEALASNFFQMGSSWGAFIHMDDVRSAEFLASLSFVDSDRIGCLGFSMGAYRSWMLASLSDVVKASASVCWMNTTEYLMTLNNNQTKGGSAYSMLLPGIRCFMDYPHVASIACPKPSLFFNGTDDKLFPIEGVQNAYRIMRRVWDDQKASEQLVTRLWKGTHFFSKEMQYETLMFFRQWLK